MREAQPAARDLSASVEAGVHLRLADVTRATFQMAYVITVDGPDGRPQARATGVTVHGCVTTAGRPTRLPAWLVDMAPGVVADGG